jgi:hypothetical protein
LDPSAIGRVACGQVPRKITAFRDFLIDWLKKSPLSDD